MPTATSELTGEQVDTASEAWRHECECRHILDKMPTREQRNRYLFGVEEPGAAGPKVVKKGVKHIRGEAAAEKIKADALRLHQLRQERNQSAA